MLYMLPEKYFFKHQYSVFLHDILVNFIKVGEYNGHFQDKIKFVDAEHLKVLESIKQEDTYDTLVNLGYSKEMDSLLIKQVFAGVLTEFIQYISTALDVSAKGQLSVTYNLLRKPFKDSLLILEWILSDPNGFLKKFKSEKSYREISIENITPDEKLKIIKSAIDRTGMQFLSADFLYELRYDKSKAYGFESIWQKANHLITCDPHYQTEAVNLNFVFSSTDAKLSQWDYLYYFLPSLLVHTVNICWAKYKVFQPQSNLIDTSMFCRMGVGYILCSKSSVQKLDNKIVKDAPLLCEICGQEIVITDKIERTIITKGYFDCSKRHRNNFFKIAHKEIRI